MILLEAAASRVATAVAEYGVCCSPDRSLRESAQQIKLITSSLDPLSLPTELRDFWTWWSPERFSRPAFDGFLTPTEALACREGMTGLGFPDMLVPIAKYGKGMIWIELQSDQHPGSRAYFGSYADPDLRLWAIGVSGVMEVLADTPEGDGGTTWAEDDHRLDPAALQSSLNAHQGIISGPTSHSRIPIANEDAWPAHWKSSSPF